MSSHIDFINELNKTYQIFDDYSDDNRDEAKNINEARDDYRILSQLIEKTEETLDEISNSDNIDEKAIEHFINIKDRAIEKQEALEQAFPELKDTDDLKVKDNDEMELDDFDIGDFSFENESDKKETGKEFVLDNMTFEEIKQFPTLNPEINKKEEKNELKYGLATNPDSKPFFISNPEQVELFAKAREVKGFSLKDLHQIDFDKIKTRSGFEHKGNEERKLFLMLHLSDKIDAFVKTEGNSNINEIMESQYQVLSESGKIKDIAEKTFSNSSVKELAEKRLAFFDIVKIAKDRNSITCMSGSSLVKRPIISDTIKEENSYSTFEAFNKLKIDYDSSLIFTKRLFFDDESKADIYKEIYNNKEKISDFKLSYQVNMRSLFHDPDRFLNNIRAFDKNTEETNEHDKEKRRLFSELVKSGRLEFDNIEQRYSLMDKNKLVEIYDKTKDSDYFKMSNIYYKYANSLSKNGNDFISIIESNFNLEPFVASKEIMKSIKGVEIESNLEVDDGIEISIPKPKKEKLTFSDKVLTALSNKLNKNTEEKTEENIEEVKTNSVPYMLPTFKYKEMFGERISSIDVDGNNRKVTFKDKSWILESAEGITAKAKNNSRESVEQIATDIITIAKEKNWQSIEIGKITRATESLYIQAIAAGIKVIPKNLEQEQLFKQYHRDHKLPGEPGHGAKVEHDLLGIVKVPEERYIRDQDIAKTDAKDLHVPAMKLRR